MTGTVSGAPGARRWLLSAATVILVSPLCGCSGSQDGAHSTSPSASPTLQSAAPMTSVSSSSPNPPTTRAGPSASIAARRTPACTAGQLETSFAYDGAGAGNWAAILRYRNVGAATCSLRGYPAVTAFDTAGRAAARGRPELNGYLGGPTSIQTINVPPGAYASSLIQGGDNPAGGATSCPDYPVLQVAAPNTRTYVRLQLSGSLSGSVPGTLSGCTGLAVNPVVAGQTGGAL